MPVTSDQQSLLPRFELEVDESGGAGIRRVIVTQVEHAQWHARRIHLADEHVHGVRRTTKRVRAVLRLVRDHAGDEAYQKNNAMLRDVARELSDARSAVVHVETLSALVEWHAPLATKVDGFNTFLASEAAKAREAVRERPELGDDLAKRLNSVTEDVNRWSMPDEMIPTTFGLGRTYRRGRRSMARAYDDPTVARFHDWRKQVKYLRHQTEVLSRAEPGPIMTAAMDLEEIGEGLGHDHDLADLAVACAVWGRDPSATQESAVLLEAIETRRSTIQAGLAPLAAAVYAPSTNGFIECMTMYWEQGRLSRSEVHTG